MVLIVFVARRNEDDIKFYNNLRRTDHTIYNSDYCVNTVPEDYRDLKIIKRGQGQRDLKVFLSSFEMGKSTPITGNSISNTSAPQKGFYNTFKINRNISGSTPNNNPNKNEAGNPQHINETHLEGLKIDHD